MRPDCGPARWFIVLGALEQPSLHGETEWFRLTASLSWRDEVMTFPEHEVGQPDARATDAFDMALPVPLTVPPGGAQVQVRQNCRPNDVFADSERVQIDVRRR